MKLSIKHTSVPIVKYLYISLIYLCDILATSKRTDSPAPISDTRQQNLTTDFNNDALNLCSQEHFTDNYNTINSEFRRTVLNEAYDRNFQFPSKRIADRPEIKTFLNVVGRYYKKLEDKHTTKMDLPPAFNFNCQDAIDDDSILPIAPVFVPEEELKHEVAIFMINANMMAYKLSVDLNYVPLDSQDYKNIVFDWYMSAFKFVSGVFDADYVIETNQKAGENLEQILRIRGIDPICTWG